MLQVSRGVLVVAAQPLLRSGIAACLDAPPLAVVGEADTVRAAARLLRTARPPLAVVVVDPPLADASAADTCTTLVAAHPATRAIVLVQEPDGQLLRLACRSGACGLFDTNVEPEQLRRALREVEAGEPLVQPSLVRYLWQDAGASATPAASLDCPPLTCRQLQALRLVADGLTSKEIAAALGSTDTAVDHLLERATERLGAAHRAHAVALAARRGLLT